MFDAKYEMLLAAYMDVCRRHEDALDDLVDLSGKGRHSDFQLASKFARSLATEADAVYSTLHARREATHQN